MITVTTKPENNSFELAKDQTVLAGALASGVNLPYGCGNGFCGSCKARLVSGQAYYETGYQPSPLSPQEIEQGMILCCKAMADSPIEIEVEEVQAESIVVEEFNTKVVELRQVSNDVMLLRLSLGEDNHMQFFAGQYVDFLLKDNQARAFSLANAPLNSGELEFHIKHNVGGTFTDELFGSVAEKDVIRVKGPLGSFFLREDSDRAMVMVAGGTGFAPIKAMVEHLLNEKSQRKIKLYWGARAEADLYLNDLAQSWATENHNLSYIPVLSEPSESWQGETGFVTDVVATQNPDLAQYEIYMTGPPPMIKAGEKSFRELGVPKKRMYSDAFEISGT